MKPERNSRQNILLVLSLVFCAAIIAAIMPVQAVQSGILELPTANFFSSLTSDDKSSTVEFTDESTGEPNEWNWDFGDGETSDQQNPTHTYTEAGSYTVILTVSSEGGEAATKKQIISIVMIESRFNKESTPIDTTIDSPPQKEIINATYVNTTTSNNNGGNIHKYTSTNNNESNTNSKNNNSGNNINEDSNNNNSDNSNHGPSSLFYLAGIITTAGTVAVAYIQKK